MYSQTVRPPTSAPPFGNEWVDERLEINRSRRTYQIFLVLYAVATSPRDNLDDKSFAKQNIFVSIPRLEIRSNGCLLHNSQNKFS